MSEWIECPKCGVMYKGEHTCEGKPTIRVEEMREALIGMMNLLEIPRDSKEAQIFDSFMYAAKVTMKDPTERRVFVQDLAASLNRKYLLRSEAVDVFNEWGYTYMETK